jgi:preprotein translocase subunit SecA
VYLRAYSQKNPLLEYKLEGFRIFDDMLYEIKTGIARKVFRVRIQKAPATAATGARPAAAMQASHSAVGQFAAGAVTGTSAVAPGSSARAAGGNGQIAARSDRGGGTAQPQQVQIKRSVPKVGRNDPCPCGSGKKYKYCHGQ